MRSKARRARGGSASTAPPRTTTSRAISSSSPRSPRWRRTRRERGSRPSSSWTSATASSRSPPRCPGRSGEPPRRRTSNRDAVMVSRGRADRRRLPFAARIRRDDSRLRPLRSRSVWAGPRVRQPTGRHPARLSEGAGRPRDLGRSTAMSEQPDTGAPIQALYLPRERDHRLGGLVARGFYRPAAKCGGDWWWFEPASKDVAWVLVGDVTGHGAASAMVTASAAAGFQCSRRLAPARTLPDTLSALHDGLRELCRGEYLMTMSALEIDVAKGEVRSFNAGGMPVFALRPGGRLQSLAKSGNPLGCAELVLGREARQLEPGERLLVYTDGLPEMKTAKRPLLGAKHLSQLFVSTAGLPLPEASDALVR